ncbi:glycerophosphodiester phosphodiesterase family protein [Roseibium denhamense]|uniref:Glycerophosphoryl diester phosphodiesterase n=1 Tax=Roseibium denhamense TaxID=76305 RepID=A0ABY1NRQ5_9HYPH|nr:glycerophosphodiester phosphodiesterase family protein [Roseibium denhamense]MTI08108.1 glycerophosphodiester phosphodiesterase family protein [Roseibium denhamense]SMP16490.1 glycerophosphoryl diester phosphodiesterase [Roseibium denhamense]
MKRAAIVCHRGACLQAPENTFAALEKAIEIGADVVEFDVRPSRDGVLYVHHDETVNRTTNGTGRFADMTSDEIDQLDAGRWFHADFAGESVPRLSDFLDACRGRIKTYAEIKEGDPAEVRDMLAARGMLADAWTFSFDQSIRAQARAQVPDLRRMVLFAHVGSVERAVALDAHILEFHEGDVSEALVAQAKSAGLITQMFYGGSDRAVFETAVRCGVEQMNIDHVELFRDVEKALLEPVT